MVSSLVWLAATVLLVLQVAPAAAQTVTATTQGTLSDEQGAVVPGATVTVTNVDTGLARTATTDQRGWYREAALPPGNYEVRAELSGFATLVRSGLTFTAGQEATINLTLKAAAVHETVTVTAAAPLIEPTNSAIGTTITHSELDTLPLYGRDFSNLANTAPGITSVGGGGINTAGQISRNNNFLVDGTTNDNDIIRGQRGGYSLETVREFQVVTNQFAAEFGLASGAVVSVVTRSGTNKVQGRAFLFDRNENLDSQDYFSKALGAAKAPFGAQRFGGYLGGPILKDRIFYFGAYEQLRQREISIVTSPLVLPDQSQFPKNTNEYQPFIKTEWQMAHGHNLSVRYRRDGIKIIGQNIGGLNTHDVGYDEPTHFSDIFISETGVLSERALNEVRFQYATRYDSFQDTYVAHNTPYIVRPSGFFGKQSNLGGYVDENRYEFLDTLSYSRGTHNFKTGFDVSIIQGLDYFAPNVSGTFTFRTDRPFDPTDRSTYPFLYTQSIAVPNTLDHTKIFSLFGQDSWRARSNLTLNLGLRWDTDTAVGYATSFPSGVAPSVVPPPPVPDYRKAFAPRLGFVWDPFNDGRTAVRGGYGVYYDHVFMNVTGNVQYAMRATSITIVNPGYPDPSAGGTIQASVPSLSVVAPDFKTPYQQTASIGVKREILPGLAASIDVVNARGFNLINTRDVNWAGPGGRRPNPLYLLISQYQTTGHSWDTALLLGLERRVQRGPTFGVSYTLSNALRDVEDFGFRAQDPLNPTAEKGYASNFRRHQIVGNITWPLPAGFQVGALAQARSGLPWSVTTGVDNLGDTQTNVRPDLAVPGGDPLSKSTYFADFTGRVGNLSRNTNIGPAYFEIDLRVSKFFPLPTSKKVEAFVEAFNLTNRANFGLPVGNLRSSVFGQSTTLAAYPRQVEIGFRFDF